MTLSEAQIKYMVDRFLCWRLPENFRPDAGISFKAAFNENTPHPMKHEPSGTNLFDAMQADAMVRNMIEGMEDAADGAAAEAALAEFKDVGGTPMVDIIAEQEAAPLTKADLAEALSCFWNAAIGSAHERQDSTAFAVVGSVAEGVAAVERRLREL